MQNIETIYKENKREVDLLNAIVVHRIGPPRREPVPRTIVGKCILTKKEEILQILDVHLKKLLSMYPNISRQL